MSAHGMPPNLLSLFAPRPPLEYMEPIGYRGLKPTYTGLSDFVKQFSTDPPPPREPFETPKMRRERRKQEKLEEHRAKLRELVQQYDPHTVECVTKNPFATLFVGRISYETTEKKLKKEFEHYGPIRRVRVITDFNRKSRGYAFIEYENEADLKKAYKQADGKKIDGRRVLVDVERSRTVPNWIPRRLGGGKGPARFTEPKKKNHQRGSSVAASQSGAQVPATGGAFNQQGGTGAGPPHAGGSHGGGYNGASSSWTSGGGGYQRYPRPPGRRDDHYHPSGRGYNSSAGDGGGHPPHGRPNPQTGGNNYQYGGAGGSHRQDYSRRDSYPGGGARYAPQNRGYGGPGSSGGSAPATSPTSLGVPQSGNWPATGGNAPPVPRDYAEGGTNGYERDFRRRSRSRGEYDEKRYRSYSRDVKRQK